MYILIYRYDNKYNNILYSEFKKYRKCYRYSIVKGMFLGQNCAYSDNEENKTFLYQNLSLTRRILNKFCQHDYGF